MKQHAHLLILTIMFLTSCSDDTEVMKQESSPPSLTEKAPTYRTKENAIIEVELFIKNNRNNTRNSSFLNYSINNEIYFYRDTITNQTYPTVFMPRPLPLFTSWVRTMAFFAASAKIGSLSLPLPSLMTII